MLILSNCLTETADEGCLKVANSLVKRIKAAAPDVTVVSYERRSSLTERYLKLNKFLLNKQLFRLLRERKEPVLYIPFPAKPFSTAVRVFVLSLACPRGLRVLTTMNVPMGWPAKILHRLSGAAYLVLSDDAASLYREIAGNGRVLRIKTGVDTKRFCPVTPERSRELKIQYGFDPERPVVLHVGHLNQGRNVQQLMKISSECQIVLVTSTLTKEEQDQTLRAKLQEAGNIRIMDDYIPRIEEIYQLADVYVFPVEEKGRCIDVPLSCLEAAACNKPVVTTAYGEMRTFIGKSGFFHMKDMEAESINRLIAKALNCGDPDTRSAVLEYDWSNAVDALLQQ